MGQVTLCRRTLLAGAAAGLAIRPALAGTTKITLGYTATLGFTGAFIAKDHDFFAKHGLDVDLVLITLNSNIPGAMMGGSIQVGGPTPTVLLQADDGGLDLVVVSGCSGIDPNSKADGLMVRNGSGIAQAADFVGKKVGVPGLNAYYHVLARKWLTDHGVDWHAVDFVEVPFTQSVDVLRSGSVDAISTGEPFSRRIVDDGIGTMLVPASACAPAGTPNLFYAATRDWAAANPDAVQGFRAAIADAIAFQASDPAGARASAGKFIKFPAAVLNSITLPALQADVTIAQLQFWIDVMATQGMLQDRPDPAKLLVR